MKKLLILALILSFASLAIFGFIAMSQDGGCLASALQGGAVCPPNAGELEVAGFHLNAFKIFTSATFNIGLLATLALFFTLMLSVFFGKGLFLLPVKISVKRNNFSRSYDSNFKSLLHSWLSFHTNSPNV